MATEIEGIYKNGKILPTEEIKLEENTKVIVTIPDYGKKKSNIKELIGTWKDTKEMDSIFKNILKRRHKDTGRRADI